jgi:PAS domain S-box-containing protein
MKPVESPPATLRPLRDARLTAINFVADAVNRTLDLKEIADNALHAILAVMKLDAGAVYIWQDKEQVLRLFAVRGISEAFARQVDKLPKGENDIIDAVLAGSTKVIEDFALTPHLFRAGVARAGFHSAVLSPIRAQGYVVGLLALGTYKVRRFEQDEIDLIEVITNQIGNAMVHAQLQTDLRASEEQYRSLVENSDDAIFIAGVDGRPRFANSAFQRIFGYAWQEMATLDLFQRIYPDDAENMRHALAKLLHGEAVQNLEYRFCRKDGMWIDLQCSASVFSREGDRVKELQFVVRDVTQAKQRQQQLLRRNRQLAALTMLAEVANSSLKIEEIARNTLEVALESTGMEGGGVHLADLARKQLHLYVQIGLPAELVTDLQVVPWGVGFSGEVAATGQARIYSDIATESPATRPSAVKHGFKSIIIVPVRAKGELLGTLGLISKNELQFTSEVVDMVTAMGNQLGIALANARLYEAQLRENEKLAALVEISSGSAQRLELESLLQRILRRSAALLKADAAYIVRHDAKTDHAEVVAATLPFESLIGMRYAASQGLFGQIRSTRQGRIFTREEVREYGHSPILRQAEMRSVLVVPLISRNELIGTLNLARQDAAASDFSSADLELMEAFASRAAVAIDNAQLLEDLQQKNELLQLLIEEAHHRIKNNLQMISGLLQLQAEAAGNEGRWAEHLQTAISRIQAIAQVHNLLSQEMPEKVDTHVLISTIVSTLVSSSGGRSGHPEVTMELEHLWLNAEQAVALALIVNELLANALLHGQPPATHPLRLQVRCAQFGNEARLVFADNGGGFSGAQDWREFKGQGMNIVAQLAQVNLRGTLEISTRDSGVCAELRFEILSQPAAPVPKMGAALVQAEA